MIGMSGQKSPHKSHCMKIGKYFSVIVFGSAIWSCLSVKSSAHGFNLKLPRIDRIPINITLPTSLITQNSQDGTATTSPSKDLRLREIGIVRDSSDKSISIVTGSIDNRSDRPHYVYYLVAKFISKDASVKQTIVPINSKIEPGESVKFNHEISTESVSSTAPETVKPIVVKYEYK
jgi:hypothetical protein